MLLLFLLLSFVYIFKFVYYYYFYFGLLLILYSYKNCSLIVFTFDIKPTQNYKVAYHCRVLLFPECRNQSFTVTRE